MVPKPLVLDSGLLTLELGLGTKAIFSQKTTLTHKDGGPGHPHGQDDQQHLDGHPAQGAAVDLVQQGHF